MSLYEDINELKTVVLDLNSRLADVEKGDQKGVDGTVKRVAKERMQSERDDRVDLMRVKNYGKGKTSGHRPINEERANVLQHSYNELRAPHPTPRPEAVQTDSAGASGTPIKFYVWKNGVMGTIDILADGDFTALP